MRRSILFICAHNSARSQMAEGFIRARYRDEFKGYSAGTDPKPVNPLAVKVMAEVGIDISGQRSKSIADFLDRDFDYVVIVCSEAQKGCPFFPGGKKCIHAYFDDPSEEVSGPGGVEAAFRRVRDQIRDWIDETFVPDVRKEV